MWTRRIAGLAIGLIGLSEFYTFHSIANVTALVGILLLLGVSVMVGVRAINQTRGTDLTTAIAMGSWKKPYLVTSLIGAIFVQFWFRWGQVLAGGDITPPIGTAWVMRIFSSYGWTGDDLGGAVMNQVRLPWGVFELVIHWLGGSAAVAQRLWLTLLVVLVILATMWLARVLYLPPLVAATAALFYVVSPYTSGVVGYNDVYFVAMALIPYCAALVVLYVRGSLVTWKFVAGFVVAAPFFGYAYINPPLVGMLGGVVAVTLVLVGAFEGWKKVGRRAPGLVGGFAALGVGSLYWILPALNSLSLVSTGNLSGVSTWSWTEDRATLPNALWLNTVWTWNFNVYNPVASNFTHFPLEWIPILLPIVVFGVFVIAPGRLSPIVWRTVSVSALFSLLILILSTGTKFPMGPLFSVLYRLPYGWLIREPGRFLMVAALGYAIMAGVVVHTAYSSFRDRLMAGPVALVAPWRRWGAWGQPVVRAFLVLQLVVGVLAATGFPVWTGAFVPLLRSGFPSTRVTVPNYWIRMIDFLNSSSAPSGALLALPADDFYQMPYSWYYGTDGFIVDSLSRHVLVPSRQGYTGASAQLVAATTTVGQALVAHQWTYATSILQALGTPLILVRGDILPYAAGRKIENPALIATALREDPQMRGVRKMGALSLFEVRGGLVKQWSHIWTTNSPTPSVGVLRVLSANQTVISSAPLAGTHSLSPLPPLTSWSAQAGILSTALHVPRGGAYRVVTQSGVPQPAMILSVTGNSPGTETLRVTHPLTTSVPSLANSTSPVSCVTPLLGTVPNHYQVGQSGWVASSGVLRVVASRKIACAARVLPDAGSSLYVSYASRRISGQPAGACLLQLPSGSCASVKWNLETNPDGWITRTGLVGILPGTTALEFVAETGMTTRLGRSETDYRDLVVAPVSLTPLIVEGMTPGTPGQWRVIRLRTDVAPAPVGTRSSSGVVVTLAGLADATLVHAASAAAG